MSGSMSQSTYPEPPPCGSDVNTINIENVDHMTIRADQVIVSKPKKRLCRRRRRRPPPEDDGDEDGDEDGDGDVYRDGSGHAGDDEVERRRPTRSKGRCSRRRRGRERRVFTVMRVRKVRDSYGGEDTPVDSSGDDAVDYSGAEDDDDDESGAAAAAAVDAALSAGDFPWGQGPPAQTPCCRPGSGSGSQLRGGRRFDRRESKEVQTIYPSAAASRSLLRMSTRRGGPVRPPYPPLQADWTQTSNHAFHYYGGPPPRAPPQGPPTQPFRQEWPRASAYANQWSQTSQHRLPPPSPMNQARHTQTSSYAVQQHMAGPPPNQQGCCTGRPCINPVICPSTGSTTFSSPLPPPQPAYLGSQSQTRDNHARWRQPPYSQPPLQLKDWTQTQNYAHDWTQTSNYRLNQFDGAPPVSGPSQQICCTGLPCRYPTICPGNVAASSAYPPFYQASQGSQHYQQGNQQPFSPRPQMEQTDWTQTSLSNVASHRTQASTYGLPPGGAQSRPAAVGDRRPEIPFGFQGPCQAQNRCCVCDQPRGPPLPVPAPERGPATPSAAELPQASFSFESPEEPRVRVQECPGLPLSHSYLVVPLGRAGERDAAAVDAAARGAARALPAPLRVAERPDALLVQCRRGADAQLRVLAEDAPAPAPAPHAQAPGAQLPSPFAARSPGDPAPGAAPLFSRGINLNVTFPLSEVTGRALYHNSPVASPSPPRPVFSELGGRWPLRGSLPRLSAEGPGLVRRPPAPAPAHAPRPLGSLLRSGAWALPRFSAQLDSPPRAFPRSSAHPPDQRQSQTRSPDFN